MNALADEFHSDQMFKKMIGVSILFHVSIVGIFTLKSLIFPSDPVTYEAAVKVDIVDLPNKGQELSKPAAGPSVEPVKPAQEQKIEPPKDVALKSPTETHSNLEKVKKQALEKLKAQDALNRLVEEEKEAEKESARQKKAEARAKIIAGATNQIKGNRLSPGTALKGLSRIEYDGYIAAIDAHVKDNWSLPEWLSKSRLKAKARVLINDRGLVTSRSIIESSGNSTYDQLVLQAIDQSSPFPAPPDKFVDVLAHDGIVFGFPE